MYAVMDEAERRHLMESLIDEIQIYEERQPSGQRLKSIRFKHPIYDEDMSLRFDNVSHIETVCRLYLPKRTSSPFPYEPKNTDCLRQSKRDHRTAI